MVVLSTMLKVNALEEGKISVAHWNIYDMLIFVLSSARNYMVYQRSGQLSFCAEARV